MIIAGGPASAPVRELYFRFDGFGKVAAGAATERFSSIACAWRIKARTWAVVSSRESEKSEPRGRPERHDVGDLELEELGHLRERGEGGDDLPAFEVRDVPPAELLCERIEREAAFLPELPDSLPELRGKWMARLSMMRSARRHANGRGGR